MAVRMLYTYHQRRHPKDMHIPSAAIIPDSPAYNINAATNEFLSDLEKTGAEQSVQEIEHFEGGYGTDADAVLPSKVPTVALGKPLGLFPQYLTLEPTTLVIHEAGAYRLPDSFTVSNPATNTTLFNVKRERPSLSHRQQFIDAQSNQTLFYLRRQFAQLPRSYKFEDAHSEQTILDLQGNFFVPTQGAKATAIFDNHITSTDNEKDEASRKRTELSMRGSWRNRNATIIDKTSGEVIATMESELINARALLWGRRTYTLHIRTGVDMAIVVGMIICLDARASD